MTEVDRREFLKQMSAAFIGSTLMSMPAFAREQDNQPAKRKPNIIFILADDLGYGDVGCYGQQMIKTPYIDRMAHEGIRFTDCYSGSTVCAPSRCCLMTGMHTGHAYIRGNIGKDGRIPLRPQDTTVAEVLKEAGYRTGIIGKWGLGEPGSIGTPNKKGFDYWFGYLNQNHAHYYYTDHLYRNEERVEISTESYTHDLFAQETLDFVRREKDNPFFLYLAYTLPHAYNEGGDENGLPVPSDYPYQNEDWPQPQKNFAAMVSRLDRDIGRLFNLLKELELDEDTMIFFASDNGPHAEGGQNPDFFNSNGTLRGIKRDMYEGGVRVPMIVRWPGRIQPGKVSDQVWASWDVLPTVAEIAGADAPDGIDGISMLPALVGKKQKGHEYLYWECYEGSFKQAVRKGHWKAVKNGSEQPVELYDLKTDLAETRDLASQHPEIVKQMAELMETARTESDQWSSK